jgi:anaerobic selenocysteine-containing dehydrogenase/Fe-S-cluster-containing dehydrogenase component
MDRRTFLKIAGMSSAAFASGCSPSSDKNLFSLIHAPDDMVTGEAAWYASTCRECPAGCGLLARNREGRVVKLEGNPLHPINRGRLCMRGQAALQGMYNPDRIKGPLINENGNFQPLSPTAAQKLLREKTGQAAAKGNNRVRMLTETVGQGMFSLFERALDQWNSAGPTVFEPFAYESLKRANLEIFGIEGLPAYRMENADSLVSFGADFLETWLSPVEYARKFKAMHAINAGQKGKFIHVASHQSLSAANADLWLSCHPGGEAIIALGLIKAALAAGKGGVHKSAIEAAISSLPLEDTPEKIAQMAGVDQTAYERLLSAVLTARRPLILGTGAGTGPNALSTDLAANLLHLALDPQLERINFDARHRVEIAAGRQEIIDFFKTLHADSVDVLLLNNVNPAYALPTGSGIAEALGRETLFVVCFTSHLDETAMLADLIIPVKHSLEAWDEYAGRSDIGSALQPTMGDISKAPHLGDLLLQTTFGDERPDQNYKTYIVDHLTRAGSIASEMDWLHFLQTGGKFDNPAENSTSPAPRVSPAIADMIRPALESASTKLTLITAPSIRFFDGRGANRSWLCEIPDPQTKIAWQSPVWLHPEQFKIHGLSEGDVVEITSAHGKIEAPVYQSQSTSPGVMVMGLGQGHSAMGRYAAGQGTNPVALLSPEPDATSGGPNWAVAPVSLKKTGQRLEPANTDGSRFQHGRKIALSVSMDHLHAGEKHAKPGLTMEDFPFTLPLPEGYDPQRDFYPPHDHEGYRWSMVVDLDRCIGCAACAAACYAENNIGVVGEERVIQGREMSWMRVERYLDEQNPARTTFLPMMCQHCDNAPCEPVCPVYAPHHSKEGLNNQIYNRCIGTRFCSQNCPYKVRRFNWFDWDHPDPVQLQFNPDVTVRAKGVMEKCSFCVQRIKYTHGVAKNEKRSIRDGEVVPACVQTCPTGALTFGSLMDPKSRVRQLVEDPRAYQVMGYVNTKPAVIYLKKVLQEI